jgi:Rrf2 family protein
MKLTRSAGYALVAVGHIASEYPSSPILAKAISKKYKIPLDYLLKILQQLVRASVLNSVRGPHGGFTLARPPAKITFLNIVEAVDGPFISTPAVTELKIDAAFNRRIVETYKKSASQAAAILSKVTIAGLGAGGKKKAAKKKTRR